MTWLSYWEAEGMVVELSKMAAKPVTTVQDYISTFVRVTYWIFQEDAGILSSNNKKDIVDWK